MHYTPDWLKEINTLPEIYTTFKLHGGHTQTVECGWTSEQESHFAFEIMLIIKGTQRTFYETYFEDYSDGQIMLIPPGSIHQNKCISPDGMTYFCLHFDIDDPEVQQQLLMYCPKKLNRNNTTYKNINTILNSFMELLESHSSRVHKKLKLNKLFIDLVSNLINYSEQEKMKIAQSDNESLILAKTIAETIQKRFLIFINSADHSNFKLLAIKNIALELNISNSKMLKIFKSVYAMSPKNYLDMLKFNEAKSLLNQPNISITEISEILGYQNGSHFSRQFKTWSGHSPNTYRKIM